jgi:hypothetical protein
LKGMQVLCFSSLSPILFLRSSEACESHMIFVETVWGRKKSWTFPEWSFIFNFIPHYQMLRRSWYGKWKMSTKWTSIRKMTFQEAFLQSSNLSHPFAFLEIFWNNWSKNEMFAVNNFDVIREYFFLQDDKGKIRCVFKSSSDKKINAIESSVNNHFLQKKRGSLE